MKRLLSKLIYSINYILPKKWRLPKLHPNGVIPKVEPFENLQITTPPVETPKHMKAVFENIVVELDGKTIREILENQKE